MEWAKKVQLVQSSATLKEFKTFVEREKDNFDSQAASMLINSVDIIENDFKEALKGIRQLPHSSRAGVYLAYYYYKKLFF